MSTIIHTPEPTSSPALYVAAMVEALTAEGTELVVICPADHDALAAFRRNPRVTVRESCARRIDPQAGFLAKLWGNAHFVVSSCAALLDASKEGDVINFQYVMHLPFSAIFFVCARLRGCRIVFTAHDPLPHKWMFPRWLRWIEKDALGWMYAQSHLIAAHSEAGKRAILTNFRVSEEKVKTIVHGPYKLKTPLPEQRSTVGLRVLLFGAIRENKGVDLAIKAVQSLHRKGGDLRLTIAGRVLNRKEQAYWDECRTLIDGCPEPIRVIEQFVAEEELPKLFADHDCFLLPYANFHSDSGVAFMALANGRPLIATGAGGLGQILAASQAGILIASASVADVGAALLQAIEMGRTQLRDMGTRGESWVMRECGWTKAASQMQAIFDDAAAGACPVPAGSSQRNRARGWRPNRRVIRMPGRLDVEQVPEDEQKQHQGGAEDRPTDQILPGKAQGNSSVRTEHMVAQIGGSANEAIHRDAVWS